MFLQIFVMDSNIVSRIAITLLAIVMAAFGVYHFLHPDDLLVFVPNYLPGGKLWVYVVGLAFILAAAAFISGRKVKLAGYLLAVLLFTFVLTIHLPNFLHAGDKEAQTLAFVSILKDTAIASFALYLGSNAKQIDASLQ